MAEPTYSYARQSCTVSYSVARCPGGRILCFIRSGSGYELRRSKANSAHLRSHREVFRA
jgi:hypothetical protein